ncbi:bifunctional lysylphosphatidylglycerol flippase/synthetase MprF [Sphingobium olei]
MIAMNMSHAVRRHRSWFAIPAMLMIAALGIIALDHLVADVRWSDVRTALGALPPVTIAKALMFTILSYLALTFYDYLALRIVGRPRRWSIAALASFCSYTLSHNLGLALLTGGSARMRIYGASGLTGGDVARVIASASLAFWGGVVMLAAASLAIGPTSVGIGALGIALPLQRAVGWTLLAAGAASIAALGPYARRVDLFGWTLTLPNRVQALAHLGLAAVDLMLASAALFILMPHLSWSLYPLFFLSYVLAIIVALLSHVPGGLGVFEAVIIALLPQVDRPALLTALIAYRVLYYLLPLVVALCLIARHESVIWQKPAGKIREFATTTGHMVAPFLLSAVVAAGGAILLASGSLPAVPDRFHAVSRLVPMPFVEASHLAASIIGAVLVLLASGLYRRLDGAFWLTRSLLIAGAFFSILKGLDYEEATVLLLIAAVLQVCHGAFYRKTSFTSAMLTPAWVGALGIAVVLSVWIGFMAYRHVEYQNDLWWQFGRHQDASRFLRAALAAGVITIAAAIWTLLRPAQPGLRHRPATTPSDVAMRLATRTDACLALTGDKLFETSPSGRAFLMYQVQGHSWIVMGDPVGDPAEWPDLLWRMRERADAAQGRLLLYQISFALLPLAIDLGLSILKYGEEARVDLSRFTLEGPAARPLRHAMRRVAREGAVFEIVASDRVPDLIPELRAISDDWLSEKAMTEKSFSIGRFDPDYLSKFDCALVRCNGRIVAFANIWATTDRKELSVDLMRHRAGSPPGVMDFIFIHLILWGQEQGFGWFTLGLAPLAGLEARRLSPLWVKAAAFLYRHGNALYGFGGLRAYKAKFAPVWEPRFIAGPQGLSLARATLDLQRLIGGGRSSAASRMRKVILPTGEGTMES